MTARPAPPVFPLPGHRTIEEVDRMKIPHDERLQALAEAIVWPMSVDVLRAELCARVFDEMAAKPNAELRTLFEEYHIPYREGDYEC